jgi:uncharacterized protein (TIGR02266 family)
LNAALAGLYMVAPLALLLAPTGAQWPRVTGLTAVLVVASQILCVAAVPVAWGAARRRAGAGRLLALHALAVLAVVGAWVGAGAPLPAAAPALGTAAVLAALGLAWAAGPGRTGASTAAPEEAWSRQHPRYRHNVVVVARDGGALLPSVTHDLSEGGCFLRAPAAFRPGRRLDLRLTMEGFAPFQCCARVCWETDGRGAYPPGVGVQFVALSKQARRQLAEMVAQARAENLARGIESPRGQ